MIYGVSFNSQYANHLGYDFKEVYKTILDDWKFKYIRLSTQWNDIENVKGTYDFKEVDYLMDEAAKRNAKVILTVGRKTPRWPECHLPDWAKDLEFEEYKGSLMKYIEVMVQRYKNHSALEIWQVENEPFLDFGKCKVMSSENLKKEINLVKKIDPVHPVMVTDSGELSTWRRTAKAADLFGTTMYKVVWNKVFGYFNYDWLPAAYYKLRLKVMGRDLSKAYIVELQAEPWLPGRNIEKTPLE